jgi:putative transposase
MARALRIGYAGACYHVINRGIERRGIFSEQRDYERFLRLCSQLKSRHSVSVFAYCLMPDHYHQFIRTKDPNVRA